jgi:hypothetical protein
VPPNRSYLPSGRELAGYLTAWHNAPVNEDSKELVRVAEWVSLSAGEGSLYDSLRELFDADYPTTALHTLMARLPEGALMQRAAAGLAVSNRTANVATTTAAPITQWLAVARDMGLPLQMAWRDA